MDIESRIEESEEFDAETLERAADVVVFQNEQFESKDDLTDEAWETVEQVASKIEENEAGEPAQEEDDMDDEEMDDEEGEEDDEDEDEEDEDEMEEGLVSSIQDELDVSKKEAEKIAGKVKESGQDLLSIDDDGTPEETGDDPEGTDDSDAEGRADMADDDPQLTEDKVESFLEGDSDFEDIKEG